MLASVKLAHAESHKGDECQPDGREDCNQCVQDVIASVNSLRDRGPALGFHMGAGYPPVGWLWGGHWQGVQRLPILQIGGLDTPHIVASSSHPESALVAVVRLETRDHSGLRLRSNRLQHGMFECNVTPDASDRIIRTLVVSSQYKHASGMQAIGKYLLVGAENHVDGPSLGIVRLFDMSDPMNPIPIGEPYSALSDEVNSVAIARLEDGTYLRLTAREHARFIDFWISRSTDLSDPDIQWQYRFTWYYEDLQVFGVRADGTQSSLIAMVTSGMYSLNRHPRSGPDVEEDWPGVGGS